MNRKFSVSMVFAAFLTGVFVCYLTLQINFFEIKKELDVPNLVLSMLTLLVGVYIADTLQKRANQNQNQHSYLIGKIDSLWVNFNNFSESLYYNTKIESSNLVKLNTEVVRDVPHLKSIFDSFGIGDNHICDLEEHLDSLEKFISNIPAIENVIDYEKDKDKINGYIAKINACFSKILKSTNEL